MSLRRSFRRAFAPAVLGVCYFAIAGATIATTRFGGGVACLWVATAVLLAALSTSPRERWPGLIAACAIANPIATGLWGLGWGAALPMAAANMAEAVIAALLIERWSGPARALDSLERLLVFCLAAGVAAPLASGMLGAGVASVASGTAYLANLRNWLVGHGLGTVTFAPVFIMVASGSVGRWARRVSRRRLGEAALLLAILLATTVAVFGQSSRPLLFVPILPVILATFRIGRLGAAAGVVIVAVVGGLLTIAGHGPITLMDGDAAERAQFFQFYLAMTVLTALPVAADLARRRETYQRLRDSQAQLRLLTDHSTDIVMNLKPDGTIRYASPSIAQLGGYAPEAVVGLNALSLVVPEDRAAVQAAHRAALAQPNATQIVEYRARTADGACRWFETHTRGVVDEEGRVTGAVSAVRDVSHRKAIEAELERVAANRPADRACQPPRLRRRARPAHRRGGGRGPRGPCRDLRPRSFQARQRPVRPRRGRRGAAPLRADRARQRPRRRHGRAAGRRGVRRGARRLGTRAGAPGVRSYPHRSPPAPCASATRRSRSPPAPASPR